MRYREAFRNLTSAELLKMEPYIQRELIERLTGWEITGDVPLMYTKVVYQFSWATTVENGKVIPVMFYMDDDGINSTHIEKRLEISSYDAVIMVPLNSEYHKKYRCRFIKVVKSDEPIFDHLEILYGEEDDDKE